MINNCEKCQADVDRTRNHLEAVLHQDFLAKLMIERIVKIHHCMTKLSSISKNDGRKEVLREKVRLTQEKDSEVYLAGVFAASLDQKSKDLTSKTLEKLGIKFNVDNGPCKHKENSQ